MSWHDPDKLREAFGLGEYRLEVWRAQDDTVVDYYDDDADGLHFARVTVRLLDDGGVRWGRFWVSDDYQGQGVYTNAHRWGQAQPSSVTPAESAEFPELLKQSGFVEADGGLLKMDKRRTKAWSKGR